MTLFFNGTDILHTIFSSEGSPLYSWLATFRLEYEDDWVRDLSSEHVYFEIFSPSKPKARAQYGKLVLVFVLVLQSQGRHYFGECAD